MPNTLMSVNTHFIEFLLLKVIEKFSSNASEDNQVKRAGAHHGPWLGTVLQRRNVIGMGTVLAARNAVWAHAKHVLVTNPFKSLDLMKVQCAYPLEKKKLIIFQPIIGLTRIRQVRALLNPDMKDLNIAFGLEEIRIEDKNVWLNTQLIKEGITITKDLLEEFFVC